ncbi:MAG TPA: class I SAM-dependent methyltransferase [Thermoanaerobaculia bacterium]|nr:class I SAM-dependent methyltransferase [Thermoanaerobaculia bacterium]
MVDTLLRTRVARWEELNRAVDERDDMLDFAIHLFDHDRDRAITNYFQNGLEQFELVRHIARWREQPVRRMLDFASGYGRLTRFLVHEHLADEITVCDILEGGMQFQREQFGVRSIVSTTLPENLALPEKYDLIFVASLFTHLPPSTFTPWLQRLAQALEPEGLLVFSVHDESIAPERVDGIHFATNSESRVLDTNEYGSTWVTEEWVRAQVDSSWTCVRLPRALADWQDIYVISPTPIEEPRPRTTPKGFVDQFEITDEGVRLAGWATLVHGEADRVEVRFGDEVIATTREFHPRPDVAAWLGDERATKSGWEIVIPHERIRSFRYDVTTVSAFSAERIFFLGTLDSLNGHVARERAKALEQQLVVHSQAIAGLQEELKASQLHAQALEQTIAAMKQSRFWRARDQWFALKRKAGLTDEL